MKARDEWRCGPRLSCSFCIECSSSHDQYSDTSIEVSAQKFSGAHRCGRPSAMRILFFQLGRLHPQTLSPAPASSSSITVCFSRHRVHQLGSGAQCCSVHPDCASFSSSFIDSQALFRLQSDEKFIEKQRMATQLLSTETDQANPRTFRRLP